MKRSLLWPRVALALRGVLALVLARELLSADLAGALVAALFLALSFFHLLAGGRLPAFFGPLVTLVTLLNGLGFVFGLFQWAPFYDEVAHAVTIFALGLASFYLVYRGAVVAGRDGALATAVFGAGTTAGAVWEAAEWVPERLFGWEVIYGLTDAMSDLIANGVGAVAAAVFAVVTSRRERRANGG